MRKYDSRNKRNIGVIVVICLVVAIVFSYFLVKEIKLSKIKYEIDSSSLVFDVDKNAILLSKTGTVKKKWNEKYYLDYNEEQYQIGSHVISFNNNELSLSLYGEFYEVNRNSEVNITKEETKLNNLAISRFYKLTDRKYLVVDSSIKSEDSTLETTYYLIIELDKLGNAILYNNNLNVKTFKETKIVTSTYTFDIANELLIYENDTVDLKKILGTTNEYQPPKEEEKEEENTPGGNSGGTGNGGTGTGDGSGTGNTGTGNGGTGSGNGGSGIGNGGTGSGNGGSGTGNGGTGSGDDIITNEPGTGDEVTDDEIINQTAVTSIVKIVPSINEINIDYVIYDTMNKYLNTFVEVKSEYGSKTVYLSKSTTSVSLNNLYPGTEYTLTFKYTYKDEDLIKEEIIDTQIVSTLLPNITLAATKVTGRSIDYKIALSSYSISSATLRLYVDGVLQENVLSINKENLQGSFDISNLTIPNGSLVELSLEDIFIDGIAIDNKISYSYKKIVTSKQEGNDNNEE